MQSLSVGDFQGLCRQGHTPLCQTPTGREGPLLPFHTVYTLTHISQSPAKGPPRALLVPPQEGILRGPERAPLSLFPQPSSLSLQAVKGDQPFKGCLLARYAHHRAPGALRGDSKAALTPSSHCVPRSFLPSLPVGKTKEAHVRAEQGPWPASAHKRPFPGSCGRKPLTGPGRYPPTPSRSSAPSTQAPARHMEAGSFTRPLIGPDTSMSPDPQPAAKGPGTQGGRGLFTTCEAAPAQPACANS